MTLFTKYRYALAILCGILFLAGMLLTGFFLKSSGIELLSPYISLAVAGTFGISALLFALGLERLVIVYRDRSLDEQKATLAAQDAANQINTFNLNQIKAALGSKPDKTALQQGLTVLCDQVQAGQGAVYKLKTTSSGSLYELAFGYALNFSESKVVQFESGEGLIGQAAKSGKQLYIDNVPKGYITILSGLGNSNPNYLLIVPVVVDNQTLGVLEIATFRDLTPEERTNIAAAAEILIHSLT